MRLLPICPDCGCEYARHHRAQRCLSCSNARDKAYNVEYRRLRAKGGRRQRVPASPYKGLAGRYVREAVTRGELPALDGSIACADCGAVATAYDHRDYWKPLEVEPVCRSCNYKRGPALHRDCQPVATPKRSKHKAA